MFPIKRSLICIFAALIIVFSIIGFAVAFNGAVVSYSVSTSGTIKLPNEQLKSPLLAPGQLWNALDFGKGNIKQLTVSVTAEGLVNIIAYSNGNKVESYKICDSGELTLSCYKIDFQIPSTFSYEKTIFYQYTIS